MAMPWVVQLLILVILIELVAEAFLRLLPLTLLIMASPLQNHLGSWVILPIAMPQLCEILAQPNRHIMHL